MPVEPPLKRKLHHQTPPSVRAGAVFHIRIRCSKSQRQPLTDPPLAKELLNSVAFYQSKQRWWCSLCLLMPDHVHALMAFPPQESMSRVVGEWKHYHFRHNQVTWQDGYFDHRIRNDHEFELKANYIRQNPVVKSLCCTAGEWLWVFTPESGS